MLLKEIYRKEFMRREVDEQYLQEQENVIVLGERFLGNDYVLVFQAEKDNVRKYYLLNENIKKSNLLKMTHYDNNYNYHVANKNIFNNDKLCKKLHNNGLHEFKRDKEEDYPKSFLVHRLVACLYQPIFEHEIHHIYKNRQQNNICNLVKLRTRRHKFVEKLPIYTGIDVSLRMQRRQKKQIFKVQRRTLSQNTKLILEILQGKNVERKICENNIYDIKKDFFYANEFLEWHEAYINKGIPALDVKFNERWKYILQFDSLEIVENTRRRPSRVRCEKEIFDDEWDIF